MIKKSQEDNKEFNEIIAREEINYESRSAMQTALWEISALLDESEITEKTTLAGLKKYISDKILEFEAVKEVAKGEANEEDLKEFKKLAEEEMVGMNKDKQNLLSLLSALNYISGNENEIRVEDIILQIKKSLDAKEG